MNKYLLCLTICFFSISTSVYAFTESDIEQIEMKNYGTTYPNESLGERLYRLENDIFGMSQSGDLDSRIEKLSAINKTGQNEFSINNNEKKQKGLKKFFSDFSENLFDKGSITGFTPGWSGYSNGYYSSGNYSGISSYSTPYSYPSCGYYGRNTYKYPNNNFYRPPYLNNNYANHPPYPPFGYNRNIYGQTYMPSDVITRSAVHILRD